MKFFKGAIVYTDGSKAFADENAHWAYIIRRKKCGEITDRGSVAGTAQSAEVMAVLQALKKFKEIKATQIIIITDSKYVETSLNENLNIWRQNGYNKYNNKPIEHERLIV